MTLMINGIFFQNRGPILDIPSIEPTSVAVKDSSLARNPEALPPERCYLMQ